MVDTTLQHSVFAFALQFIFVAACGYLAYRILKSHRWICLNTPLNGPPPSSWIYGVIDYLRVNPDWITICEGWVGEYGSIFKLPAHLGSSCVFLSDPEAIAHCEAWNTSKYISCQFMGTPGSNLVCDKPITTLIY